MNCGPLRLMNVLTSVNYNTRDAMMQITAVPDDDRISYSLYLGSSEMDIREQTVYNNKKRSCVTEWGKMCYCCLIKTVKSIWKTFFTRFSGQKMSVNYEGAFFMQTFTLSLPCCFYRIYFITFDLQMSFLLVHKLIPFVVAER